MNGKLVGACIFGQSGGPTAVINASAYGVIKTALESENITKVYGASHGIVGVLNDELFVMDEEDPAELELLLHTPSSELGSCRYKIAAPEDDDTDYKRILEIFKKYNVRYFFYNGGNDSMDTVAKLTEYLKTSDWDMRVIGVPKTIDNDLAGTDHTPGYGSAAKYIAATLSEIIRDCAVYTVKAVTIVEIMGRDAGWLTAAAGLMRLNGMAAPDYIYLPEVPFSFDAFLEDVTAALEKHPNVVIAVSEGVRDENGRYAGEGAQSGAADVFGHKYLSGTGKALEMFIKEKIGCKTRSVELNLPQRCAAHIQSKADVEESLGVGEAAVKAAAAGSTGCMMAMERSGEYDITFVPKDISGIANAVRSVPREMINERGNNVTDECLRYILPMIHGEVYGEYENGIPVHFVL